MKYMLMDYVNEAGWPQLKREEQVHWLGAYTAYMEAMAKAGVLRDSKGLQPTLGRDDRAGRGREDQGAGWPICRLERAAGGLSHHRGA